MKPITLPSAAGILFFLVASVSGQTLDSNTCIECHLAQDAPISTPAEVYEADVHTLAGLGCEVCHGGDPAEFDMEFSMDPTVGYIGVPEGQQIVEMCGQCHSDPEYMRRYNPNLITDQVDKYWTSGHGMALRAGNGDVATCVSCHSVHQIKRVGEPASAVYHANVAQTCGVCHSNAEMMARNGLTAVPVSQYMGSVHGIALLERGDTAAPTCNNCHGNHGAIPPELSSI
ncbi:cytochrome c3 family protein, partial [Candidatus Neomarinimicrobiota bacterium]